MLHNMLQCILQVFHTDEQLAHWCLYRSLIGNGIYVRRKNSTADFLHANNVFCLFFVLIQCTVVVLSLLPAPSPACGRLQSVCGGRESVRLKVNFLLKDPCENELRCDHRVRFRENRPTEQPVLLTGNHDSLRLVRGGHLREEGRSTAADDVFHVNWLWFH